MDQPDAVLSAPEAIPLGLSPATRDALAHRLHDRLVAQLDIAEVKRLPEAHRRGELQLVVARFVANAEPDLAPAARAEVVADLLDELLGLGPLERLLRDPGVGDVLVNGPADVWVERAGKLHPAPVRFRDDDHLLQIIDRIVARVGRRIDESSPMVDARLADGSRVNAVVPPLSLKGPALSIRRFPAKPLTLDALLDFQALTPEMALVMEAAVKGKLNVLVSGGTGSGKTTLLNTLSAIHVIVQAERLQGGARRITSMTEVVGMEGDIIVTQEFFAYQQLGVDSLGRAHGQFATTGVRPTFAARLKAAGLDLPIHLFGQRVLLRA